MPADKLMHLLAGVVIYAGFHFVSPVVGLVAVLVAAVAKEIYDYFHRDSHTPDVVDALATVAGGLIGFVCGI